MMDYTGESHISADWLREKPRQFWGLGRKLLGTIRRYQRHKGKAGILALLITKLAVLQHRFWSVITGADIPPASKLGGGLLIHQHVTIGVKRGSSQPPIVASHVDIGAGAKIIGPIKVADDVLIGVNSVVVRDVSAGLIVAGIPAKVIGNTAQDIY